MRAYGNSRLRCHRKVAPMWTKGKSTKEGSRGRRQWFPTIRLRIGQEMKLAQGTLLFFVGVCRQKRKVRKPCLRPTLLGAKSDKLIPPTRLQAASIQGGLRRLQRGGHP